MPYNSHVIYLIFNNIKFYDSNYSAFHDQLNTIPFDLLNRLCFKICDFYFEYFINTFFIQDFCNNYKYRSSFSLMLKHTKNII